MKLPVVHFDNFIEKTVNSSEILKEFCIENKVFESKILFSITRSAL
jgi:hypothetical protein